jgi:tape measure domain-containing protein
LADVLIGDVVARLRADVAQFNQALNDVVQRLGRLNQATQQVTAQGHREQLQAQRLAAQAQAQAQAQAHATSLQATRLAAQADRQAQAQAQSALLHAARAATQAHAQVQAQGHAQQLQATKLAAQAQLQAQRLAHAQALQDARIAAQERARAARGSDGGLGTVLQVAGGIGVATGLGAIIGQMKELAVQTVQVGTRFESLRASLSALGGSQAAGFQQFQMLTDTAQRLGVALEPLARGFRQLTAAATQAGLPLAEQQRLLTALAVEARRVGASNEELGRAITAIAQIASKGKVSMEELRQQLGEALPTAMAAAARGMGKTTEELTKLVETGTLGFTSFARGLTRGFEQLQGSGGQFAEGLQQAFNRLSNAWKILQDTIVQGGLNTYLITVVGNLREAVEWTTKLLPARREPSTPDIARLTPTADQSREVTRLQNLITLYNRKAEAETNVAQQAQYVAMVERAREQLNQSLAAMEATKAQTAAQDELTKAANQTAHAQEQQADFVKDLTKALEDASKAAARFRAEAGQFPERFGRLGGTLEEAKKYRQGLEQAQSEPLGAVGKLISGRAAGVVVPPELLAQFTALRKEYGGLAIATKAADEAEKARQKTLRETERVQQEALRQAEQAESQLPTMQALLGRAGTLLRRPDENVAEEARSRAQQQYVQMQADLEKALETLGDSPALQKLGPTLATQLKDMLAQIPQAIQAEGQHAFDRVIEQTYIEPLRRLAEAYGLSKEATDLDTASKLAAQAVGTAHQAQAEAYLATITAVANIEAQLPQLRREAELSAPAGIAAGERARTRETFDEDIASRLAQLRAPREEREGLRLRRRAEREGVDLTPELEQQLKLIDNQIRWNSLIGEAERLGDQAAQTITTGLLSIVDGTHSVSEGFRAMAKSILDSVAQVTLNEGFRALIRLGIGVAVGALAGGGAGAIGGAAPLGGGGASSGVIPGGGLPFGGGASTGGAFAFQHGGVVNRPTLAMIGEGPAHTLPEYVLNRPQMNQMMASAMRSGPSAGGQAAGNVVIINVPNAAAAEREAAQQRAMGHQVIINTVMNELSQGSGSRLGQVIKTIQR